jgi:hypothetical protein
LKHSGDPYRQVKKTNYRSLPTWLTLLGHDIQLKILQALPSLLQNYPAEIRGESLSAVLQICSSLQNAKNFAVSNTAAATLQQLVIVVFDRAAYEDGIMTNQEFLCAVD